jgi:hypothetical protein
MIRWSMGSGRSDGADVKGKRVLEREKGKGFWKGKREKDFAEGLRPTLP